MVQKRDWTSSSRIGDGVTVRGRVVAASHERFVVSHATRHVGCVLSGKLRCAIARGEAEMPIVGDTVAVDMVAGSGLVHMVEKRRNYFSRKYAGSYVGQQLVAANIDCLCVVMALDRDFSLQRLDRYIVMAGEGNVRPVVVLTKTDLVPDPEWYVARASYEISDQIPVVGISARNNHGLDQLTGFLQPGTTTLLVGSSGVGKSTLVNTLLGEVVARTQLVHQQSQRGRCTTTDRRMYCTASGAFLIDTPGAGELQLWARIDDLDRGFGDITRLARGCRFSDCGHRTEPGCMVKAALLEGELTNARYENYLRMRSEIEEVGEELSRVRRAKAKHRTKERGTRRRYKYGA